MVFVEEGMNLFPNQRVLKDIIIDS